MQNVKKKKKPKHPLSNFSYLVMFSYLLWASEIVFRTNTLHSLLATLPSKAVVEVNCGCGILFSGAPPGDLMDGCPASLLLLMQHKNVLCHSLQHSWYVFNLHNARLLITIQELTSSDQIMYMLQKKETISIIKSCISDSVQTQNDTRTADLSLASVSSFSYERTTVATNCP